MDKFIGLRVVNEQLTIDIFIISSIHFNQLQESSIKGDINDCKKSL